MYRIVSNIVELVKELTRSNKCIFSICLDSGHDVEQSIMELKDQINSVLNHSKHESNRFNDFIMKTNQSIFEFKDQIKSLINRTMFKPKEDLKILTNLTNEMKKEPKNESDKMNKSIVEMGTQSKLLKLNF